MFQVYLPETVLPDTNVPSKPVDFKQVISENDRLVFHGVSDVKIIPGMDLADAENKFYE